MSTLIFDGTQGLVMKTNNLIKINKYAKKSFVHNALIATSLLFVADASALDVEKKIIVSAGAEHNSNPQLSLGQKNPVWIYSLLPRLLVDMRDEVNHWYVDAGLQIIRNSNEKSVVNQENPQITAGWNRSYESGFYGIKVGYDETIARLAELNVAGTFTNFDNIQKTKSLGANWQHRIAPRWLVLTEAAYSDVDYSRTGILDDFKLANIQSKLSYENTEKLTTNTYVAYSQYDPSLNRNSYLATAGVGASYQVSEDISIVSRLGAYDLSGRQEDSGLVGGLQADYNTTKIVYSASVGRNVNNMAGLGYRITDSAKLGAQYGLTEVDRIGADYTYDQFKRDRDLGVDELTAQSLGVFYARNISEHWTARLYANHIWLDVADSKPKNNVIGVTFVFDTLNF